MILRHRKGEEGKEAEQVCLQMEFLKVTQQGPRV